MQRRVAAAVCLVVPETISWVTLPALAMGTSCLLSNITARIWWSESLHIAYRKWYSAYSYQWKCFHHTLTEQKRTLFTNSVLWCACFFLLGEAKRTYLSSFKSRSKRPSLSFSICLNTCFCQPYHFEKRWAKFFLSLLMWTLVISLCVHQLKNKNKAADTSEGRRFVMFQRWP